MTATADLVMAQRADWHVDLSVLRDFHIWYQTHATSRQTVPSLSR